MNTTNQVYTYHQSVVGLGDPQKLIDLWAETWSANGWVPSVLGLRDAIRHPSFKAFSVKLATHPTVNPAGYDLACYLRHLAMEVVGGGILTDYDVMNRGLHPSDLMVMDEPVILEPAKVPCAVVGTTQAFKEICAYLWRYKPSKNDLLPDGRMHVSDMSILQQTPIRTTRHCVEPMWDGWKEAPLIHFSTGTMSKLGMRNRPKHEVIAEILEDLPELESHGLLESNKIPQI